MSRRRRRAFRDYVADVDPKLIWVGPKTLILIWPSEQVETNTIAKIIKFSFQGLFMG